MMAIDRVRARVFIMKSAQRLRRIAFVFVGLVLLLALVVMLSPSKPNASQLNKSRLFPPSEAGPEDVEIVTQLDTLWQSPAKTEHRTTGVKCVTGLKTWFIEGEFTLNGHGGYWLVGTNVVEEATITSSMYLRQAKEYLAEKVGHKGTSPTRFKYPHAGAKWTRVRPWSQGLPALGMGNVIWLAFCSGSYLKQEGRQIPAPLGPPSQSERYLDKTVVFGDEMGLPQKIELCTTNGQLVCRYEVLRMTNFHGHTFPLQFRLVQYPDTSSGLITWGATAIVSGKVTSIKMGRQPRLPDDARKQLER